jgi:protein-disulfide isomerase
MAAPGNNNQPGKKDRREAAREKARLEREAEKRRQRRNRIFIQGGIGIVVLAIVAVIALVIVNVNKPAGPGPLNMASDGILLTGSNMDATKTAAIKAGATPTVTDKSKHKTTVNIVTYIDYQCPYCEQFETTNADQIATWVKAGEATIEIHPIAILDSSSLGNKYATRAANAAACVANYDPNNFYAVNTALYANQPAENTSGKSDTELLSTVSGAGSGSAKIKSCITSQQFVPWVTAATARVHPNGDKNVFAGVANTPAKFGGTPTVFVNGVQYTGSLTDATAFASFTAQQVTG